MDTTKLQEVQAMYKQACKEWAHWSTVYERNFIERHKTRCKEAHWVKERLVEVTHKMWTLRTVLEVLEK